MKFSLETRLMALMVDNLSWLVWSKTKDAEKGRNRPNSIYNELIEGKPQPDIVGFENGEEFERVRDSILRRN